ncbi:MAG: 6-phosphogluconolactonase [Helicobacteraceae bacterium]|nr:6-phosphogluconolactonase [Helicobacteraceae bacterium]
MSKFVHAFTSQSTLINELSRDIACNLQEGVRQNGRASLLVSGGSTPKPLFETLSQIDLPWEKVTVGLCDERWVDPSDEASNEHFVKEHLLQGKAAKATFVGMYSKGVTAESAQQQCTQKLKELLWPFDVTVLGMGTDGHTASLFPHNYNLEKAFEAKENMLCIAIEPEGVPYVRMSLTRSAILSSKHLYLHFEGPEKRAVYQKVIKGDDIYEYPVRAVLQQEKTDIKVYFR